MHKEVDGGFILDHELPIPCRSRFMVTSKVFTNIILLNALPMVACRVAYLPSMLGAVLPDWGWAKAPIFLLRATTLALRLNDIEHQISGHPIVIPPNHASVPPPSVQTTRGTDIGDLMLLGYSIRGQKFPRLGPSLAPCLPSRGRTQVCLGPTASKCISLPVATDGDDSLSPSSNPWSQ